MGWFEDAQKTMVENLQTSNLQTHLDKYPVGSDIYPVVPILVDRGVEWVGLKMPTKQWSKIFKPSGKPPECHLSTFTHRPLRLPRRMLRAQRAHKQKR